MPEEPTVEPLAEAVEVLVALAERMGPRAPWDNWRAVEGLPALGAGPGDVARWVRSVAGHLDAAEIDEVLEAVSASHRTSGLPDPTQGARLGSMP